MPRISGRILFDLVLLAGACWGLWLATRLPASFSPGQVPAGFFPSVVLGIGIVVMLAVLWGDVRASRAGTEARAGKIERGAGLALGLVAFELVAYIVVLERLGFLVSTAIFLFVAALSCAWTTAPANTRVPTGRLLTSAAIVALVATGLTFVVFTQGFGLIFP